MSWMLDVFGAFIELDRPISRGMRWASVVEGTSLFTPSSTSPGRVTAFVLFCTLTAFFATNERPPVPYTLTCTTDTTVRRVHRDAHAHAHANVGLCLWATRANHILEAGLGHHHWLRDSRHRRRSLKPAHGIQHGGCCCWSPPRRVGSLWRMSEEVGPFGGPIPVEELGKVLDRDQVVGF